MTCPAHTPTHEYSLVRADNEDGSISYEIWHDATWLCTIDEDTSEETPVDARGRAAFIVKACNAHDELVELLRAYYDSTPIVMVDELKDKTRAILAKVQA